MTLKSIFVLGRVLFPMELVNGLIALVGRPSISPGTPWAVWRRLQIHKDFSAETPYYFESG